MAREAIIQRAVEGDVPVLLATLAAHSAEIGDRAAFSSDAAARRLHGFGPRPLFRALIATEADNAVAMGIDFLEFSTMRGRPGVYLQDIYVIPEARATGLGRRLLGAVVRDAADRGAVYLKLAVYESNESALGFYHRLGFQTDPREQSFWIEGAALGELRGLG